MWQSSEPIEWIHFEWEFRTGHASKLSEGWDWKEKWDALQQSTIWSWLSFLDNFQLNSSEKASERKWATEINRVKPVDIYLVAIRFGTWSRYGSLRKPFRRRAHYQGWMYLVFRRYFSPISRLFNSRNFFLLFSAANATSYLPRSIAHICVLCWAGNQEVNVF